MKKLQLREGAQGTAMLTTTNDRDVAAAHNSKHGSAGRQFCMKGAPACAGAGPEPVSPGANPEVCWPAEPAMGMPASAFSLSREG